MQQVTWPMLTFPPINLWNAPILEHLQARREAAAPANRSSTRSTRSQRDVGLEIQSLLASR